MTGRCRRGPADLGTQRTEYMPSGRAADSSLFPCPLRCPDGLRLEEGTPAGGFQDSSIPQAMQVMYDKSFSLILKIREVSIKVNFMQQDLHYLLILCLINN